MTIAAGRRIGTYEMRAPIGAGGMEDEESRFLGPARNAGPRNDSLWLLLNEVKIRVVRKGPASEEAGYKWTRRR